MKYKIYIFCAFLNDCVNVNSFSKIYDAAGNRKSVYEISLKTFSKNKRVCIIFTDHSVQIRFISIFFQSQGFIIIFSTSRLEPETRGVEYFTNGQSFLHWTLSVG